MSITIPARVRRVLHRALRARRFRRICRGSAFASRPRQAKARPSARSLPGLGAVPAARGLRQFLTRLAIEYYAGDIGFIISVASTATINSEKLCPPAGAIRQPRGMILLVRRDADAVPPLPNFRGKSAEGLAF
jgi:hypothetical protein